MLPVRTVVRRVLGGAAALAALGASFTAGVVAGSGSSRPAPAGVLDEAAAQIENAALQPVDRAALDAAALDAMLTAAGDPWGSWGGVSPSSAGVGLWLRRGPGGRVVVDRVTSASAAAQAGARVGDEVRGVDDASVRGLPAARVAGLLRGPAGSSVAVTLARGGAVRTHVLRRAVLPDPDPVRAAAAEGAVVHLTVSAFQAGVGRQVRAALAQARADDVRGVLLDLRGNPGGRLDEAVETASAFLDGGPVVSYVRRGAAPRQLDAVGDGDTAVPLVVLVDGGTASAAEVVAGALQDRGRAVLVGSRTYGKGSVQEPRPLPGGASLALTVARWTTPAGRSLEGVGLVPDIEVAPAAPAEVAARRGADVLTGLLAGAGGRG